MLADILLSSSDSDSTRYFHPSQIGFNIPRSSKARGRGPSPFFHRINIVRLSVLLQLPFTIYSHPSPPPLTHRSASLAHSINCPLLCAVPAPCARTWTLTHHWRTPKAAAVAGLAPAASSLPLMLGTLSRVRVTRRWPSGPSLFASLVSILCPSLSVANTVQFPALVQLHGLSGWLAACLSADTPLESLSRNSASAAANTIPIYDLVGYDNPRLRHNTRGQLERAQTIQLVGCFPSVHLTQRGPKSCQAAKELKPVDSLGEHGTMRW